MRLLLALVALLPAIAVAQQSGGVWVNAFRYALDSADVASGKSVFQVSKPDLVIQITKHRMGADMFEITALDPTYPPPLLSSQINALCTTLNVPARGLSAGRVHLGGDPKLLFTKATFATNGIIDSGQGKLNIAPILQAFAGAPAPYTVHALSILFNGEQANPNVLRSYSTPYVRLQATANVDPPVIEYRVQLLTQDPKLLTLPAGPGSEQKQADTASTPQRAGIDWALWIALFAAAAAAGILVYFFILRASAKPRR